MKMLKSALTIIFKWLDRAIEAMITITFFAMVIIGGMQVFNRYALGQSLSWSEEAQKFMHIWIIFLAIPLGYKRDAHIGMKVIYNKFPKNIRFILDILIDLLWLGLGIVMLYYTGRIMQIAQNQTSPGLGLRMDWVYLCMIIGGGYLSLMALRKITEHLIRKFKTSNHPEAKPC